ncbi:MAG: SDR family oxidoreductase [Sphingomonadales bacterium]|nr:SDR family oxidoreductase [Sphingomonadales bacterium]
MDDIIHAPIGMLAGKVAVITGAGQGMGRACVDVFVREGARVLAVDFSGKQDAVARDHGGAVVPFHADVSQEDEIKAMFAAAIAAFGRLDASIHVAGTQGGRGDSLDFTLAEYELMTATNLRGVMFCTQHAAKVMVGTGGGSIVNFTSVAGVNGEQLAPLPYTAAKAGVHMVSKVMAIDYAKQGVRVNVIAPGFTITEMMDSASPEILAHMGAKSAIGRPARAQEQAEVAAFLASDRASYVTGTVIPVDGGWTARVA